MPVGHFSMLVPIILLLVYLIDAQKIPNTLDQRVHIERLCHIAVRPGRQHPLSVLLGVVAGDGQYFDVSGIRVLFYLPADLNPVHIRQYQVQNHKAGFELKNLGPGLEAACRRFRFMLVRLEGPGKQLPNLGIIINDENFFLEECL